MGSDDQRHHTHPSTDGQLPNETWQTVKWIAGCAHPQRGDILVLPRGVHSLIGAGGSDTLSEAAFETPDANPRLVTLGAETYCKKGFHTSKIVDVRQRRPWLKYDRTLAEAPQPRERYQDWLAPARRLGVFTDGSFRRVGTTAQKLNGTDRAHCQSSIVKQSDDGTYSYLAITNDHVQHSSAYTTELIAEEVALRYSNGIVHTDCQSAKGIRSSN